MRDFLEKLFKMIGEFLASTTIEKEESGLVYITITPKFGDAGSDVAKYQAALRKAGYKIDMVDTFGPQTKAATSSFQKSKGLAGSGKPGPQTLKLLGMAVKEQEPGKVVKTGNTPWMDKMKKDLGSHESDKELQKKLVPFWKKIGLNYKSLVGSKYAWCGLAIVAYLYFGGVEQFKGQLYRAASFKTYGLEVDWKTDGIPRGAIVWINTTGACRGKGNHVTFSECDYTPQYLKSSGATLKGRGGNQSNRLKVSVYKVAHICAVRWPDDDKFPKPGRVINMKKCESGEYVEESTQ